MDEVFDEWRVTGQPAPVRGNNFPPYNFIWSKYRGPAPDDPEGAARAFVALFQREGREDWLDGPHLHRRTVIRTGWKRIET